MRCHVHATLVLLLGTTAACRTEQIEPDVFFLTGGNTQSAGVPTYLEIAFEPSASVPRDDFYRVLVDGRWALRTPEDKEKVVAMPSGSVGLYGDNLAAAPRTISLAAPSGGVALTTAPLTLTPGTNNQLVVYGDASDLRYYFFANSAAELDTVPDGSILTRVIDVMLDKRPIGVETCKLSDGNVTDCAPLVSSLAYGQLWQGILPRTSVLAVDCPSQGCMSQQLAIVCAPPSGQGLVAPKAVTFGFMAGAMLMTFETLGTCGVR